jgi:excisionase family DNA binding protein
MNLPSSLPANRPHEVMDLRECAAYLGISADALYKYAIADAIPAFKLGNRWRFKLSLIDEWMEAKSNGAKQ